jgi:hypothetical protein
MMMKNVEEIVAFSPVLFLGTPLCRNGTHRPAER